MAAPDYVPVTMSDRPRTNLAMPPSRRWTATRPADLQGGQPSGPTMGTQGPDQGYALQLAQRFEDRLQLSDGEDKHDVMAACVGIALRRATLFGRAPVIHDQELSFAIWGLLGDAPEELVEYRRERMSGASHNYWLQREIADQVPESTLRLTPAQATEQLSQWRSLLGA